MGSSLINAILLLEAHARVDESNGKIGKQVTEQQHHAIDHQNTHDDGEIACLDRLKGEQADALDVEDALDQEAARDEDAEKTADTGGHRNERIAQSVHEDG